MTPREFGSFTIWMLVVTGATHSAYAQNNSLHGPAMEVTPFMSHDSTFRWRTSALRSAMHGRRDSTWKQRSTPAPASIK
jgi:hypothetical protein